VDLIALTESDITYLCKNVTPEMRNFCGEYMSMREWPEVWLADNVLKNPAEDLTRAPPYSEQQWWGFIRERRPVEFDA
jgi:hypothetical protein